jgi:hypothetical protein
MKALCYVPVTKQQQLQITFRDNTESCANDNISEEARKYNQHLSGAFSLRLHYLWKQMGRYRDKRSPHSIFWFQLFFQ